MQCYFCLVLQSMALALFVFFVCASLKLAQTMKFIAAVPSLSQKICLSTPSFIAGVSGEVCVTLFWKQMHMGVL